MRWDNRFNDVLDHVLANLLLIDISSMLSRDNYRINTYRLPILVLYCNLAFAIRSQVSHWTSATPRDTAYQRELAYQFMSQADGHWHILRSFVTGKADHHALVTGSNALQFI